MFGPGIIKYTGYLDILAKNTCHNNYEELTQCPEIVSIRKCTYPVQVVYNTFLCALVTLV